MLVSSCGNCVEAAQQFGTVLDNVVYIPGLRLPLLPLLPIALAL